MLLPLIPSHERVNVLPQIFLALGDVLQELVGLRHIHILMQRHDFLHCFSRHVGVVDQVSQVRETPLDLPQCSLHIVLVEYLGVLHRIEEVKAVAQD